ncbi:MULTISPECIES: hypothetical protein [Symbiopectobacterium]|uniref:hypothetical protein n=1 Tax=Symbiopectobacterium TaxID=801 RepID=UPI002079DB45|nr:MULTISPECIES: hypothetical protein [Symbiopectobacterium]MBT9430791.1 hypothetical protein [Candidatus Symbiopectobacterium endolongispinus]
MTAPLPLPAMKDIVNNVMMHSASQPDYQGVPFSPPSPVTVEELQQASQEAAATRMAREVLRGGCFCDARQRPARRVWLLAALEAL